MLSKQIADSAHMMKTLICVGIVRQRFIHYARVCAIAVSFYGVADDRAELRMLGPNFDAC